MYLLFDSSIPFEALLQIRLIRHNKVILFLRRYLSQIQVIGMLKIAMHMLKTK